MAGIRDENGTHTKRELIGQLWCKQSEERLILIETWLAENAPPLVEWDEWAIKALLDTHLPYQQRKRFVAYMLNNGVAPIFFPKWIRAQPGWIRNQKGIDDIIAHIVAYQMNELDWWTYTLMPDGALAWHAQPVKMQMQKHNMGAERFWMDAIGWLRVIQKDLPTKKESDAIKPKPVPPPMAPPAPNPSGNEMKGEFMEEGKLFICSWLDRVYDNERWKIFEEVGKRNGELELSKEERKQAKKGYVDFLGQMLELDQQLHDEIGTEIFEQLCTWHKVDKTDAYTPIIAAVAKIVHHEWVELPAEVRPRSVGPWTKKLNPWFIGYNLSNHEISRLHFT